ncbi:MAG TPA: type VI secretion system-associated FHA domain protein TagH [Roseiarcus sp.]|nr:type VI secretion system-associated FHA domain protein TagH [Roseiarcus sp.]
MTLRLSIENMDRLPDGGPLRVQVQGRGLDIGRDQHLDWTLPDPSRHVSGKHCEIRFRDGGYWLHDVSSNGTFVNGRQYRLDGPHLLRNGDRLSIGPYIVAVEVEGQSEFRAPAPSAQGSERGSDPWSVEAGAAEPDDPRAYQPQRARPNIPDFLEFASDIPSSPASSAVAAPRAPVAPDDDWLRGPAAPAVAEPIAPPSPTPRRPAPRPEPTGEIAPPYGDAGPAPLRAPAPPAPAGSPTPAGDLLLRIARAAGIAERAFEGRDPTAIADDIGAFLQLTAHNLAQMLASRSETKGFMRSSNRTMIRALENNPLKFTASPNEALSVMFGPPTKNYLDARAAVERSFADLKAHQIQTFGAMQAALEALFEDLAPEKIDRSIDADRGIGALVGSRKARLWDAYVERWRAKAKRSDGRLTEAFMTLFAESYDRLQKKDP